MGRVKGNQQQMVTPGGLGAVTSSGPNLLGRKQSWHLEKAGIAGQLEAGEGWDCRRLEIQTNKVGARGYIPRLTSPPGLRSPIRAEPKWPG